MVTVAAAATVFTANVAFVDPAGTTTLAGTVAALLLLASVIVAPPVGAAADRVTVPVTGEPPETVVNDSATEDSDGVVVAAVVELVQADAIAMRKHRAAVGGIVSTDGVTACHDALESRQKLDRTVMNRCQGCDIVTNAVELTPIRPRA